ncbi:hypothetical protein CMV30_17015 [Nibricoccus aquaticus]|uniref:Uncharacterized protein n=2 Tax=Nibricoccus aquaticus TaxID=2576891 RepID=A0A290QE58_9BACT|nr:hypothetical protein CMV30_17015 [Nibricoccus aquaticus]
MKPLGLSFAFLCVSAVLRADSFVADRHCSGVAEILQKKLPELAVDRLFEAKRDGAEWHYAFWTKAEKTWFEEVRITVRQKAAYSSVVVVEVFRLDGGLVKTKSKPEPLAAAVWTTKIGELLKEEPNQSLQHNASTGSVSNFQSPARRG